MFYLVTWPSLDVPCKLDENFGNKKLSWKNFLIAEFAEKSLKGEWQKNYIHNPQYSLWDFLFTFILIPFVMASWSSELTNWAVEVIWCICILYGGLWCQSEKSLLILTPNKILLSDTFRIDILKIYSAGFGNGKVDKNPLGSCDLLRRKGEYFLTTYHNYRLYQRLSKIFRYPFGISLEKKKLKKNISMQ